MILLSPSKKRKKNLDSYCFVTSFWLFIFENDVHVPSKSNKQKYFYKNLLFVGILGRSMTKIAGSGSATGSESGIISQRHGSADPDPDRIQPKMSWIRNTALNPPPYLGHEPGEAGAGPLLPHQFLLFFLLSHSQNLLMEFEQRGVSTFTSCRSGSAEVHNMRICILMRIRIRIFQ